MNGNGNGNGAAPATTFIDAELELRESLRGVLVAFDRAAGAGVPVMPVVIEELAAAGVELPEFVRMMI